MSEYSTNLLLINKTRVLDLDLETDSLLNTPLISIEFMIWEALKTDYFYNWNND